MMTTVTYKALKRLKIGDGYREIGDEVPEAAEWKNLWAYLRGGDLEKITRPDAPERQPTEPVVVTTEPEIKNVDQLRDEARRSGIRVDGRWSAARLRREIGLKKEEA